MRYFDRGITDCFTFTKNILIGDNMKKSTLIIFTLFLAVSLFSAQTQEHEVTVTNISVPVRVYDGSRFIENLSIQDFEVYENGKLQKIEALYLTRNAQVERKEAEKDFSPQLTRSYYLLFQSTEYDARFSEAIDYFFNNVIQPGDNLTLMTPVKNYVLPTKALKIKSKESLSKEMQAVLRKDTTIGSSNYRNLITDLKRLVRNITTAGSFGTQAAVTADIDAESTSTAMTGENLGFLLSTYRTTLQKLEELRLIDEAKLTKFAMSLKRLVGQKSVFFFYEREFRPEISGRILGQMISNYQDQPNILGDLQDLFQFYQRNVNLDVDRLKAVFADSNSNFNFFFLDKAREQVSGITMREQSEDVFSTFVEVARATGGIVDNSQNSASAFRNALNYTEAYYLLYYTPTDKTGDGQFNTIEVKVKNRNYTVAHRAGYISQ
jgi:hypothetical protein